MSPIARSITWLLLAMAALVASPPRAHAAEAGAPGKPLHQLRIYDLVDGNQQVFHDRFRDHALRIMRRHGFNVIATWESRTGERTEFVYLLEWPNRATMQTRWQAFMADQEWSDLKKLTRERHGPVMGAIQDRVLELTDYSPGAALRASP